MELLALIAIFLFTKAYEKWKAEPLLKDSIYVDFRIRGVFFCCYIISDLFVSDNDFQVVNMLATLAWFLYGVAQLYNGKKYLQNRETEEWFLVSDNKLTATSPPRLWPGI